MMMNEFYVRTITTFTNNWGEGVGIGAFNLQGEQRTGPEKRAGRIPVRCSELIKLIKVWSGVSYADAISTTDPV